MKDAATGDGKDAMSDEKDARGDEKAAMGDEKDAMGNEKAGLGDDAHSELTAKLDVGSPFEPGSTKGTHSELDISRLCMFKIRVSVTFSLQPCVVKNTIIATLHLPTPTPPSPLSLPPPVRSKQM
eukprot:CAMPEP_0119324012 /NCGR_PEP_ID=MMETSP1333-20130426/62145_1 /TAXON_ID=418940 /ORGANISM="Scyphosphaera apsteinii, Strain RCC1455" /LENGTH=124 /DNA_ID=CAMNT_0007331603 /DNA_START=179 /DNA_END=551 /DNA_ORIENTATION=+